MAFLFGVALYMLRDSFPFHWSLGLASLVMGWFSLSFGATMYLSALPVAYLTVYVGLLNPPRTLLFCSCRLFVRDLSLRISGPAKRRLFLSLDAGMVSQFHFIRTYFRRAGVSVVDFRWIQSA